MAHLHAALEDCQLADEFHLKSRAKTSHQLSEVATEIEVENSDTSGANGSNTSDAAPDPPSSTSARAERAPTVADLTRAAVKSAASRGLPPRAVLDLMLLPIKLLGIPTSLDPASLWPHILSLGPIPAHIAFIMDGNRRFARSSSLTIQQGHMSGFEALKKTLDACLQLGAVKCVTVYAFAIDNFKRDTQEVNALMQLAKTRLLELAGHGEVIARHSVRVRVIGRRHLLPNDVRVAMEKVENMTKNHSRATLNVCMPYASRDEMALSIRASVEASLHRENDTSSRSPGLCSKSRSRPPPSRDISQDDLEAHMMLADSPPLDVLVRTSGVNRLSDFMLWQANENTQLHFADCYWPEFGWRQLAPIILDYQRQKVAEGLRGWLREKIIDP
ncbi:Undecaprenyl diphosphate synthase [Tilletiaria anomala UBC 951]|uniref:Alkyl transferase n=1 Tax=Tilletiaria anomala (strain ATCC 24038 / CBS 436.72 / UBC 951) TaxID=1037660 RepID=A0A066V426_TILAU|nr:Undecaprenyl diphosphate synthase [Tilletiaria anomala UBC 951]KDN36462.1 Undecaprenyl diphosphate synthase [Tilletiaria anomala UBC 951]